MKVFDGISSTSVRFVYEFFKENRIFEGYDKTYYVYMRLAIKKNLLYICEIFDSV